MLTLEYKLRGKPAQFAALDEAIRTVQFIRNTCLRLWMDQQGVTANDLQSTVPCWPSNTPSSPH